MKTKRKRKTENKNWRWIERWKVACTLTCERSGMSPWSIPTCCRQNKNKIKNREGNIGGGIKWRGKQKNIGESLPHAVAMCQQKPPKKQQKQTSKRVWHQQEMAAVTERWENMSNSWRRSRHAVGTLKVTPNSRNSRLTWHVDLLGHR